jgi:acetyl esterase/lipase
VTHVLDRAAREPDAVLSWGPDPRSVVDVYRPPGTAARTVVLLHGGFWRVRYDRTHLRPLAAALAADGMLVALPEYRRVGEPDGGHPGTFDDVLALLDALPDVVPGWGAPATLVGHSAGGHLAVWSQAVAPSVDAVVSLGGVLDLSLAWSTRLGDGAAGELLHAGTPGFAERLAAVDPVALAPAPVRVELLHGDRDDEVPVEHSIRYAAHAPHATLRELTGIGHYEPIDPTSSVWPTLLAVISG